MNRQQAVPLLISGTAFLLPCILRLYNPFIPRDIIHPPNTNTPLFLHAFSCGTGLLSLVGRILQVYVVSRISPPPLTLVPILWSIQVLIGVVRCLFAFIFTRAVGWAHPFWFSHSSLYEPSAGPGPALVVYMAFRQIPLLGIWGFPLITFTLCWLDNAPWTYGVALICAAGLGSIGYILNWVDISRYLPDGRQSLPITTGPILRTKPSSSNTIPSLSPVTILKNLLPTLLFLIILPSTLIPAIMVPYPQTPALPPPTASRPILQILVLTYPRPDEQSSYEVLSRTIESYVPYLSKGEITMSIFTHSVNHPSFTSLSQQYRPRFDDDVMEFFVDDDMSAHNEAYISGQYLHLAEAFRHLHDLPKEKKGEWIMLVEDDFPVCDYPSSRWKRGWDVVLEVVRMLEGERLSLGRIRSGFVGTGGSGLIFHHTYLPLLSRLLLAYASQDKAIFPPTVLRRPPDLVVQDCLLGQVKSLCETSHDVPTMLIPSRLVLDHIGGLYTTTHGKRLNTDKWRCGWRHPFHGTQDVEIVVV